MRPKPGRLAWARQFHPVPRPLARGRDAGGSWLVTTALPDPAPGKLAVCHSDTGAPSTLPACDGRWSGHVGLGLPGTTDRWAGLAAATWSADWNYGPGWDRLLPGAYGIRPDPQRTRYNRLLWDLSS